MDSAIVLFAYNTIYKSTSISINALFWNVFIHVVFSSLTVNFTINFYLSQQSIHLYSKIIFINLFAIRFAQCTRYHKKFLIEFFDFYTSFTSFLWIERWAFSTNLLFSRCWSQASQRDNFCFPANRTVRHEKYEKHWITFLILTFELSKHSLR